MLVRQGVGQLVNQSDFLEIFGCPRRQVEFFRLIVIKRRGLFGQDVDVLFGQVEIFTDEAKHLESQLFGSDFLRRGLLFEPTFDQISNLLARDDRPLDGPRQASRPVISLISASISSIRAKIRSPSSGPSSAS